VVEIEIIEHRRASRRVVQSAEIELVDHRAGFDCGKRRGRRAEEQDGGAVLRALLGETGRGLGHREDENFEIAGRGPHELALPGASARAAAGARGPRRLERPRPGGPPLSVPEPVVAPRQDQAHAVPFAAPGCSKSRTLARPFSIKRAAISTAVYEPRLTRKSTSMGRLTPVMTGAPRPARTPDMAACAHEPPGMSVSTRPSSPFHSAILV